MSFTLDNFVRSILAVDAAIGDTSLVVALAAPPLRDPPAASAGAPGILILQDQPTAPTKVEIVTYTGVSIVGTQVTLSGVTRALEGTTAQAWTAGTRTFSGSTAAVLAQFALKTALATVATSGQYDDLAGKPTLGTAAAQATGAFATAAQGVKADTALQGGTQFATAAQGAKADAAIPESRINGPASSYPGLTWKDSGTSRWSWSLFPDESFQLVRYDAAGVNQGSALSVDPATGAATFPVSVTTPIILVSGVPISLVAGYLKMDGAWIQASTIHASGDVAVAGNITGATVVTTEGITGTNLFAKGVLYRGAADAPATALAQPRTFVQSTDPAAAAADGDLWVW